MSSYTLLSLLALCTGSVIGTVLEINQGQLLGVDKVGLDDVPYVSYLGIPYAKQPVGDLRFKAPESAESWDGVLNATIERASCIQYIWGINALTEPTEPDQEGCLYINVHTPATSSDDKLPVFVWIYGGAYSFGSGNTDIYGPDYLVSKGLIVVTFNYRTDVFGYLSLDIPEAPGNIGQRDQVAALRWTRDNIAAFGGDPDSVTLGGQSTGAASAHLLALSPMGEGLFQKVILMSGSALHSWAVSSNNTDIAFEMAGKLNYTTTNATELYESLRAADSSDLYEASKELLNEKAIITFQPVVEKVFDGVEPFLTEQPIDIVKSGNQNDIKYLIGFTAGEGIEIYNRLKTVNIEDKLNQLPATWIPSDIDTSDLTSEEISDLGNKIKSFFLGDQEASESTINELINWTGTTYIQYKSIVAARLISSVSSAPVYLYENAFDGNYTIIKSTLNLTEFKYFAHYEDLGYLFQVNSFPGKIEDESPEDKVRRSMVELWTNFIKYGNPTPETNELVPVTWAPTSSDDASYLRIDSTLSLEENPLAEEVAFWDGIYTATSKSTE